MLSQGRILNCSGGDLIYPGLSENEFLSSPVGLKAEANIINEDNNSYDIASIDVGSESFSATVFFKHKRLWMLSLYLVDGCESGFWSNWSEEKELKKKATHDKFLNKELGKLPYDFDWGKITSIFDRKGGASSIVMRYK